MPIFSLNKMIMKRLILLVLGICFLPGCAVFVSEKPKYDYDKMDRITERIHKKVESFLETCVNDGDPIPLSRFVRIDSLIVDEETEHLDIYLNRFFSHPAYREENIQKIYAAVQDELGWWDSNYTFTIYTTNTKMEELVPNFYRSDSSRYDRTRLAIAPRPVVPLVRNQDKSWLSNGGLYGKHIALWHSHGWYYEPRLKRWEWQRARLFQSVEDLGPLSYTLGYIVPMLENAGANVFLPRERDMQTNEVIIDNDAYQTENMNYKESALNDSLGWKTAQTPGFAIGSPPYGAWVNPFKLGSARYIATRLDRTAAISWVPQIPEKGKYAVYVSYAMTDSSITDARYTVYHTGGKTEFKINQKMGGNTWVYLGEFVFREGTHPDSGKVVLTNESETPGGIVTADAVRFGGGMGNVIREGQVSGRPRYIEAARYYLQYAGMPDTLVYTPSSNRNDYTDDYRSRGEWVNYLKGAPYGPNSKRDERGLGIPIDISLAFHTDAGISKTDTVIGTLSIYSTFDADSSLYFPDGVSRFANRDFADILQSEIVEDIRREHDPVWNRRDLWDRGYSEAFRPNVPAALLELLSHQNFLDMKFFLDPQFRFTVSRSIYKSILKFLATQNGEDYVVQPLPVKNFLAVFEGPEQIYLRWDAQADPVEATAMPDKYILYTRVGDSEFDNGRLVNSNYTTISNLEANVIYGFKVAAANDGGESFPSEILSACRVENGGDPVLIINGFDRVSGPATVETDKFRGFANFIDAGVADKYDLNYTGSQFNFEPKNPWTDDDAPGFGSSYADMETKIIPGNTFDFSYTHGKALRAAGRSFVSVSDDAVMAGLVDVTGYKYIDLILGEEKKTFRPKEKEHYQFHTFPDSLKKRIEQFCQSGGNLFISGAYVGTDLFKTWPVDTMDTRFARNTLKYFLRTDHAVRNGDVFSTDSLFASVIQNFQFNTAYRPEIYSVEAPDAIEPADSTGRTVLRYKENNMSAAVAAVAASGNYKVVVFGFPFETILEESNQIKVMTAVFEFFEHGKIIQTDKKRRRRR